ncbi:CbtB-domain containing protein [Streptomyces cocklensis]|nr:CbtB-domain containing protein [Actinacidiphila cocklensis]MDD1059695.1 CbtB-domain containing protein [Actinacidiphila cocklensis]
MPAAKAALWMFGAAALALIAYYFVGVDQGAVSVFGKDMHVHEFVHDARHFLGFPCH